MGGSSVRCFVPGPAPEESKVKTGVQKLFDALAEMKVSLMGREIKETRRYWDRSEEHT